MKRKYVVFDWDGTLADTYPVIAAAYDYTFDKMKLSRIPYDEIKRITSTLQNKDILGYVFNERREEAGRYFYEYIEKYHTEKLAPMKGAADLLDFCRDNGLACFLLTNKKTKFIREEMEKLGFTQYFKKVVAAGECPQDKPHPVACRAVFEGNLPPAAEIVVIGDGEADVLTAETYNDGKQKARCIIYDPKGKYKGKAQTDKVEKLSDVPALLERE